MSAERPGAVEAGFEVEDRPRENCGIMAVYNPDGYAADAAVRGLGALQHRGEHSAGISVNMGEVIMTVPGKGRVSEVFNDNSLLGFWDKKYAIAHTRYATGGKKNETDREAQQPFSRQAKGRGLEIAVAHNGEVQLSPQVLSNLNLGKVPSSDSAYIPELIIAKLETTDLPVAESIATAVRQLEGAYSLTILVNAGGRESLFAVRDPFGFRPLMYGEMPNGGQVVASEIDGLTSAGARFEREVEPGEMLEIVEGELKTHRVYPAEEVSPNLCFLEIAYIQKPTNPVYGTSVARYRKMIGGNLAETCPAPQAEVVVGVPESGILAAFGFAETSGLPYEQAIFKNGYRGRAFMSAEGKRRATAKDKLTIIPDLIADKHVALVDDSIIRGDTTKELIAMLKDAGAAGIHLRSATPRVIDTCNYGVNISRRQELLAFQRTNGQMMAELGLDPAVDSLGFLPRYSLFKKEALGSAAGKICTGCMTSLYPGLAN